MSTISILWAIALGSAAISGQTQESAGTRTVPAQSAAQLEKARNADVAVIQKVVEAFTKAFNAGDASAVVETFTPDGLVVDTDGNRVEGREALKVHYAAAFAERPGGKISIQTDSIRFLGPQTGIEEGLAKITMTGPEAGEETSRFTTIYVKHEGHWLQAMVRDEPEVDITPHQRLKQLEWLVGEWVNESPNSVVHTTCKWTEDGNFLVREFSVKSQGESVLSGTQRIGWDPVRKQFKLWVFDSEGGFGEGFATREGDRLIIKAEGVRQDGQHASVTNVITQLGKDRMRWQSLNRTIGGSAVPGVDQFVIVRKPPELAR